jgi:hypothetical protein
MSVLAVDDPLGADRPLPARVQQVLGRPAAVEGDVRLELADDIGERPDRMGDAVAALLDEMDYAVAEVDVADPQPAAGARSCVTPGHAWDRARTPKPLSPSMTRK